jgi:hypothetical protein
MGLGDHDGRRVVGDAQIPADIVALELGKHFAANSSKLAVASSAGIPPKHRGSTSPPASVRLT